MADEESNRKVCKSCGRIRPAILFADESPDICRRCGDVAAKQAKHLHYHHADLQATAVLGDDRSKTCALCRTRKPLCEFAERQKGDGTVKYCWSCVLSRRELRERHGIFHQTPYIGPNIDVNTPRTHRLSSIRIAKQIETLDRQSHDDTTGQASPPNRVLWEAYIASSAWKALRGRIIQEREKCERCGSLENLQVHHTSYRRLGYELPEDLLLLCNLCHEREHGYTMDVRSGVVSQGVPKSSRQWGLRDGVETKPQRNVSLAEYYADKAQKSV